MRQSISTNTHWSSDGNKLCKLNCDTLQATKVNARVYGHVSLMFTRIADQSQAKPFLTKAAFTAQSTAENNFTLRNPMVLSSLLKRQQREKLFSEVNRNFSQSHRFIISSRRVSNNEYRKKKRAQQLLQRTIKTTKKQNLCTGDTRLLQYLAGSMQLWLIATEPRRAYLIFHAWTHRSEFHTEALVITCVKWDRYTWECSPRSKKKKKSSFTS